MSVRKAKLAVAFWIVPVFCFDLQARNHSLDSATPACVEVESRSLAVEANAAAAVVNLYRTGDFRHWTKVSFSTEEITASEGIDYKGTGGTIVFRPGEEMKTISIQILSNGRAEGDETFRLTLRAEDTATTIVPPGVTLTIRQRSAAIPPKLQVRVAEAGNIAISWEGKASSVLERASDPTVRNRESFNTFPAVEGEHCEVTEPVRDARSIFRLKVP